MGELAEQHVRATEQPTVKMLPAKAFRMTFNI